MVVERLTVGMDGRTGTQVSGFSQSSSWFLSCNIDGESGRACRNSWQGDSKENINVRCETINNITPRTQHS